MRGLAWGKHLNRRAVALGKIDAKVFEAGGRCLSA